MNFCVFIKKLKEISKAKEYSNEGVTIVWKPEACIHSAICVKGLPDVIKPKDKPWIKIDKASTYALIKEVKQCIRSFKLLHECRRD